jgi:hypothetical protein
VIDAEESYEHTLSKVENILGQFHQQVSWLLLSWRVVIDTTHTRV